MATLTRPRNDRVIAGVCSGLARRFDVSPGFMRVLAMLLVIFAGLSLWVYVILWVLIPNES